MISNNSHDSHTSERKGTQRGYGGVYYSDEDLTDQQILKDEIDVRYLFIILLRNKWWVLSITLVCTAVAYIYAQSLESIYTGSGTILIAEEGRRPDDANSRIEGIVSSAYGVGTGSKLENEIQLLQSRRLAGEIATKLLAQDMMKEGGRFPILWREYGVDSTLVNHGALTGRIRGRMQVERVNMEADIIRIAYSSISPLESATLVNTTIDTYVKVSANQRRMDANSALEFLAQEREAAEKRLRQSEEALHEYMKRTNIVEVDGQTSAVINRLAELGIQLRQVQVERVSVQLSINVYEEQLKQIRPGLAEQFADNISSTMQRSQFRLAELETERMLLLQRNPSLRNNPGQEPQLVPLNEDIAALKGDINRLANDLAGDKPDVFIGFLNSDDGDIANRVTELRQNLIELSISASQLDARENVLNQRLVEENRFFDELPDNMMELARLRRNNQVNEQLYSTISENYTGTSLRKQTEFGAGRPLDYAVVPAEPSGPNRGRHLSIGFLMGFMISAGFILIRENLNRSIDGTGKLRETGYPLLAVIPDVNQYIKERFEENEKVTVKGKSVTTNWTVLLDTVNPIAEAYRRLQNNIVFSDPDKSFKTILVTSSIMGEGKTTISINLAVALAESGKKVLLIDSDLRRPNIHKFTGENRKPGVAEFFYDQAGIETVIRSTVAPGVDVLTAGRTIPNPSAVLQSLRMRKLLEFARQKYDHVLVDTPPFGVITDAAPMLRFADAVVLVTKFGVTEIDVLNNTIVNLERIHANIAGIVITAYNHRKSTDYYYSGKYSYYDYTTYGEYTRQR